MKWGWVMKRDRIVEFASSYLNAGDFSDYCVNGLQVAGVEDVSKVVSGVSISARLIDAAISRQAQMVLVHHGFFRGDIPDPLALTGVMRERLALILRHDINVVGYHLPLDAHPKIGNNALACKRLRLIDTEPVYVGFVGCVQTPESRESFVRRVEQLYERKVQVFPFGPDKVTRVAVVSGGSSPNWVEASRAGADTLICGDMRESIVRAIEEAGINVINAGHYATEKLGIIALSELLSESLDIDVEFVDIPNPV